MHRRNGEDLNKPLGRLTALPWGAIGISQPIESASQPRQREGEQTGLFETQAAKEYRRGYQQTAKNVPTQGYTLLASQGPPAKVTPFRPDRVAGPVQFISKLLESWNLTAADAVALLGFEQADRPNVEAILAGRLSLRGRDAKDRIAALFRIKSLVGELFRECEYDWMVTPRSEFANRSPIEMLKEGSMQSLLTLRQYVEHIAGL